ncbi:MAG: FAD-binding oxidoreductase [Chloroflexota bacterium]|nr:MAG: FAD-binding oxidoreductase [Chloroflexota bacterium]
MTSNYDVIIVGGGIMGCCSAYELAKRGLRVALFDKNAIGEGPTGQSSAIIRQHYSNELTARMALYSLRVFQDFGERVGGDSGFTQTGFIAIVDEKDRAGLEANIALQREVGIKTELLDADSLQEILPALETCDLMTVAYEPESGYADPYLTVNAYAQAARRHGVTIFQNTEVTSIRFDGRQVSGVEATGDRYGAPIVLNCAGAWGASVAKLAGASLPIDSCRVEVAFFRRPAGHEAAHPVVADLIKSTYLRSETGELTLVGLIDPGEADAVVDPDNYQEYLDDDFILEAGERLIRRYPAMERSDSTGGYASLYAITPDWHPVVDEVRPDSGFYVCSGFSGHGFKLGPAVGLMTADLLTGVSDPTFSSRLFRLARFAENDPVRGQYEYSIVG